MDKVQTRWQVDWRRVGEYLLGRSTLIGIASLMLLLISGYATWHGMHDFIIGVSGSASHDSSGGLSIPNDLLVVVVVAAEWTLPGPLPSPTAIGGKLRADVDATLRLRLRCHWDAMRRRRMTSQVHHELYRT